MLTWSGPTVPCNFPRAVKLLCDSTMLVSLKNPGTNCLFTYAPGSGSPPFASPGVWPTADDFFLFEAASYPAVIAVPEPLASPSLHWWLRSNGVVIAE